MRYFPRLVIILVSCIFIMNLVALAMPYWSTAKATNLHNNNTGNLNIGLWESCGHFSNIVRFVLFFFHRFPFLIIKKLY